MVLLRIVALLRDLHSKESAQDLCTEARDLIFRTPSGQPIRLSRQVFRINPRHCGCAQNEAL
jgi:hypothetical protein